MQNEHKEEMKQEGQAQTDAAQKPATEAPKPQEGEDTPGEGSGGTASAEGQTGEAKEEKDDADIQPLKIEFMKLDLSSLASTMEFINAYKAKGYPLHVLICNAGLGLVSAFRKFL